MSDWQPGDPIYRKPDLRSQTQPIVDWKLNHRDDCECCEQDIFDGRDAARWPEPFPQAYLGKERWESR